MPGAVKAPAATKRAKAQVAPSVETPAEVDGGVNDGHQSDETEESQEQDVPAPNGFILPQGPPEGVYPQDADLFSYTPKSTGVTIWFPMEFTQPDAVQVWEQYDKPFHVQTWEWMKWAKIPRPMQRIAVELLRDSPQEYLELFDLWMRASGGVRLGE